MPIATLLALALALPQGDGWTALPLPSLCVAPSDAPALVRLESGRHIVLAGDDLELRPRSRAATLPAAVLLRLLQDDALARGLSTAFHPSVPPVLVRGPAADVAQVRGLIGELDRAGRELDVELRVWIVAGAAAAGDRATFEEQVAGAAPYAETRVRSGGTASLGRRTSRSFVTGYEVEVATDSGVADPVIGRALLGTTLHLRPCRARAGTAVHLEGFLDVAELAGIARFDPGTPDLGLVEQPELDVLQLAFSGVVAGGGRLQLVVSGAPFEQPDFTVWIEATTRPDPVLEEPGDAPAWRGVDLALLETRVVELPMPSPGSGLAELARVSEDLAVLTESFPASAVAQGDDTGRSARGRAGPVWTEGYLLLPPTDADLWSRVQNVVDAVERERLRSGVLELRLGEMRVQLPVSEGYPARVLAGREHSRLVDFDAHIAQESWMPAPRVEPVFDGLLVQGTLRDGDWSGVYWVADTTEERTLTRAEVNVGKLQMVDRSFEAGRLHVPASAAEDVRKALGGDPVRSLSLGLRTR